MRETMNSTKNAIVCDEEANTMRHNDSSFFNETDSGKVKDVASSQLSIIDKVGKLRMSLLEISSDTKEEAKTIISNELWSENNALDWLYQEWFNDLAVFQERFIEASQKPDQAFLEWIDNRVKNPNYMNPRAADEISRRYDHKTANLFYFVRWAQEISWARRLRTSDDPRVSVMAALFLTDTRKNPIDIVVNIVRTYFDMVDYDVQYYSHPNHDLTVEEIMNGHVGYEQWTPLFLIYAEYAYGPKIDRLSYDDLINLSKAASKNHEDERRLENRRYCLSYLDKHPLSCRISALHITKQRKMSSNDLVSCEQEFKRQIEIGNIDVPENETSIDRVFFEWLRTATFLEDRPDNEEMRERLTRIALFKFNWFDQLPSDVTHLGARDKFKFNKWRADVLNMKRPPPISLPVDYSLYILENS